LSPPAQDDTHSLNYTGVQTLTLPISDTGDPAGCGSPGVGCAAALDSAEVTVPITVSPVNDKPSAAATPDSLTLNEDGSTTVALSDRKSVVEGEVVEIGECRTQLRCV